MIKKIRKAILNYIPTLIKTELLYRAPFLYRFIEIRPSSCTIMITDRCNLKCIMCKQWREPKRSELSTDEWKRIIIDLKNNGIKNIHFTGGEPLLRRDLQELISFCFLNGLVAGVTTNGLLLNSTLLQELVDAGIRSIALSIDALNGEYDKIRGVSNSFEQIERNIFAVSQMKKRKKIDVYINFTLMKNNIKELRNVKNFADKFKLPLAVCLLDNNSFIFNLDENRNDFWIKENSDFKDLNEALKFLKKEKAISPYSLIINFPAIDFVGDYFRDPQQEKIPCVSSQDRIIIDPCGNLLGGCMSMGSFGNLQEKKLKDLTLERRYKVAKKNMFYKRCLGCSCGYLFNIRLFPFLVIEDIVARIKHSIAGSKNV